MGLLMIFNFSLYAYSTSKFSIMSISNLRFGKKKPNDLKNKIKIQNKII